MIYKIKFTSSIDEDASAILYVETILPIGFLGDIITPLTPYNVSITTVEKTSVSAVIDFEGALIIIDTLKLYSKKPLKK